MVEPEGDTLLQAFDVQTTVTSPLGNAPLPSGVSPLAISVLMAPNRRDGGLTRLLRPRLYPGSYIGTATVVHTADNGAQTRLLATSR